MDVLLSPPLHIELLKASPAKSYEEVTHSLTTCLNDAELLPNIIGGNTYQIKAHLCRIIDEVAFLNALTTPSQPVHSSTSRHPPSGKTRQKKRKSEKIVIEAPSSSKTFQSTSQPAPRAESISSSRKKPRIHKIKPSVIN